MWEFLGVIATNSYLRSEKKPSGQAASWHLTLSVEQCGDRDNLGQLQRGAKAVGSDSHMGEHDVLLRRGVQMCPPARSYVLAWEQTG